MKTLKRIKSLLSGLFFIISSILLLISPKDGYEIVVLCIDVALLLYGIRLLVYYFTLARYMVGGIMTLYKSIILIDFGIFMIHLEQTPQRLMMLYLTIVMIFNGATSILAAVDAKKLEASFWKSKMAYGIIMILLSIGCIFAMNEMQMVTIIYAVSLLHAGVYNISTAFQKTAIIHIE